MCLDVCNLGKNFLLLGANDTKFTVLMANILYTYGHLLIFYLYLFILPVFIYLYQYHEGGSNVTVPKLKKRALKDN